MSTQVNSDTPETDSALYPMNSVDIIWPDFARRLERERNKLKEQLEDWDNAVKHVEAEHPDEKHCGCVPVLRKLLNDARRDKDALLSLAERAVDFLSAMGACETDEWVQIHSSIEKIKHGK
jgi:uncharacterized protein (UPF0335 family)